MMDEPWPANDRVAAAARELCEASEDLFDCQMEGPDELGEDHCAEHRARWDRAVLAYYGATHTAIEEER